MAKTLAHPPHRDPNGDANRNTNRWGHANTNTASHRKPHDNANRGAFQRGHARAITNSAGYVYGNIYSHARPGRHGDRHARPGRYGDRQPGARRNGD